MDYDQIALPIPRSNLAEYLDAVKGGQFIRIFGYVNQEGEKADYALRFGIKYGNLKERDVRFVQDALAGSKPLDLHVRHNVWMPDATLANVANAATSINAVPATLTFKREIAGVQTSVTIDTAIDLYDDASFTNRKAKDRTMVALDYRLPSSHPAAVKALQAVLDGFLDPAPATADYDKQAKSLYSLDSTQRWYLRDVLVVAKRVILAGNYQPKASAVATAVKDAIRRLLLTGKYRQMILTDGQFDHVTIEGQAFLCDGIDEQFYVTLPESMQAVAQAAMVA